MTRSSLRCPHTFKYKRVAQCVALAAAGALAGCNSDDSTLSSTPTVPVEEKGIQLSYDLYMPGTPLHNWGHTEETLMQWDAERGVYHLDNIKAGSSKEDDKRRFKITGPAWSHQFGFGVNGDDTPEAQSTLVFEGDTAVHQLTEYADAKDIFLNLVEDTEGAGSEVILDVTLKVLKASEGPDISAGGVAQLTVHKDLPPIESADTLALSQGGKAITMAYVGDGSYQGVLRLDADTENEITLSTPDGGTYFRFAPLADGQSLSVSECDSACGSTVTASDSAFYELTLTVAADGSKSVSSRKLGSDYVPDLSANIERDIDRLIPAGEFLTDSSWTFLNEVTDWQQGDDGLLLTFVSGHQLRIEFLGDDLLRVRFAPDGEYDTAPSYAIPKRPAIQQVEVLDSNVMLTASTASLTLEIDKAPFALRVLEGDKVIHATDKGIGFLGSRVAMFNKVNDGVKFYGLGEKSGPLVKNGQSVKMWNTDAYGYDSETDPLYSSIPFFIETDGDSATGVLLDNTHQTYFNLGSERPDEYYVGALDGELDYYVIHGDSVKEVIGNYTGLTGRTPMPPKWALGYQQSRYSYETAERIDEIADGFRSRNIPADVLYLDIDYMDQNRSFTWDHDSFPDLPGMLERNKARGFKFISIIDPHIKIQPGYHVFDQGIAGDHFLKMPDGTLSHGPVWPGDSVFPDYSRAETRTWWGTLYQPLIDAGMDGFWNDMNEPSVFNDLGTLPLDTVHDDFGRQTSHLKNHNVYGMTMIQATREGLKKLRPEHRNFVLSRAGYAGVQRYAAVWTGDNTANWEHLKLNLTMGLTMGLSGVPFVGADVGGFVGSPYSELFARWMQMGVFFPLYRNHTAKGESDQEPWMFGPEVEEASREAIELRYQLLPLFYDLMHEAHTTGLPASRPLFMEFPDDDETYALDDQLMLGDALLAAPVIKAGQHTRSVYLPAGSDWVSYDGSQTYAGGQRHDVNVDLSTIPMFVRAGALIPTQAVEQYVGELEQNPVTFRVYPAVADSAYQYRLYRDDDNSTDYQEGHYQLLSVTHTVSGNHQQLRLSVEHDGFTPNTDHIRFQLLGAAQPQSITYNGEAVSLDASCDFAAGISAYCYDSATQAVLLQLPEPIAEQVVTVDVELTADGSDVVPAPGEIWIGASWDAWSPGNIPMEWNGVDQYTALVTLAAGEHQMKFTDTDNWSGSDWGEASGLSGTVSETTGGGGNVNFNIDTAGDYLISYNPDTLAYAIVPVSG